MKHLLLFVLLLLTASVSAQKLSDEQIKQYLDALQKEQIISEFGKDAFIKSITKQNQALKQRMAGSALGSLGNIPDSVLKSRAAILGFIGVFELIRNVGSAADEMVQLREMSEKMLGEQMFFKPDIEGEINAKNPLTFLGLEQNLKPAKANYLKIAQTLKEINLIDAKVLEELTQWLEKDRIKLVNDFGFFIYAAKQTWFYDNYAHQKDLQFKLIDSLQVVQLLSKEKAQLIKSSYKPYELKSKIDILSYVENIVIIENEQGNFTREEIYQNLYGKIKEKLVPTFNFKDLTVKEISKVAGDNSIDNLMGLPFRNPLEKDKKPYKLAFTVDGLSYAQKADTDFSLIKTLQKSIPPDVHIDSTVIKSYAVFFSSLLGITTKDFQSVNDFLVDTKSSKRLIIVNNEINPLLPIKDPRKALLLVDSTQQSLLVKSKFQGNPFLGSIFGEKSDFSDKLSRDNLTKLIKDFQENEILPVQDKSAIEQAIVDFRFEAKNRLNVKRSLLLSFPAVIAKINFNSKVEDDQIKSYKDFLSELSRVSQGKFKPEKVTDNFETEIVKGSEKDRNLVMSFRLKDKKYEYKQEIPKIDRDAIQPPKGIKPESYLNFNNLSLNEYELVELVNYSLEENKIDGTFYKINSNTGLNLFGNASSNYVFFNKKQYSYIDKNHSEIFNEPVADMYHSYQAQVADFSGEDFAAALKRENMLTEENLKGIDLGKAKEPSVLLKNSAQAVVIDMNELVGKSNTELYTYVLNKFGSKLLPKVAFSEVNYKDVATISDSTGYGEKLVSLKINGKLYEQTLFVSFNKLVESALDSLKKEKSQYFPNIGENQFKVINDYLNDIDSPQRLVIVCDYRSPNLAFVLFDSTQATLVSETLPNNYVDFTMYDRQFSRDSLQNTLYDLGRMGIIDKMSDLAREEFILKFRRTPGTGKSLLEQLPKVIVQSNIWDLEDYEDVYKSIMDSLSTIGRNEFNPVKVTDNFKKTLKKGEFSDRTFKYSFVLNDKLYEEKQLVKGVPKPKNKTNEPTYSFFEFDTSQLIELVNKSLNEKNSEYSFYQLMNEDSEESVGPQFILLSPKQYRWLKVKFPEVFENYDENRMYESDKIEDENKN